MLKQIDPSVLKRPQFESKRCYENAVWLLDKLNSLVALHNNGYKIFERGQELIPDLNYRLFDRETGLCEYDDDVTIDKTGELCTLNIGGCMMIGQHRELKRGRIFVSMKESKEFLLDLSIVEPNAFKSFREFFK